MQPTAIPAFAPRERPIRLAVGDAELADVVVACVVEGVLGDVCDVLLLLRLVAVDALLVDALLVDALLDVDETEDGNNQKPGLVAVVKSRGSV